MNATEGLRFKNFWPLISTMDRAERGEIILYLIGEQEKHEQAAELVVK